MAEGPKICTNKKCRFRVPDYSPLKECPKCGAKLRRKPSKKAE